MEILTALVIVPNAPWIDFFVKFAIVALLAYVVYRAVPMPPGIKELYAGGVAIAMVIWILVTVFA